MRTMTSPKAKNPHFTGFFDDKNSTFVRFSNFLYVVLHKNKNHISIYIGIYNIYRNMRIEKKDNF